MACILEFECTNNATTEYKELVHVIEKEINLGVREIQIFGDSEIVVWQVKNQIHYFSMHLLNYRNKVHKLFKLVDEISIQSIPCNQNSMADLLANIASKLIPLHDLMTMSFFVQRDEFGRNVG